MMKLTLRLWTFAGLVCCSGSLNAFAAESVVYQFDDWKVTITPGRSTAAGANAPIPKTRGVPVPKVSSDNVLPAPANLAPARRRVDVLPISLKQDAAELQPSPMPNEVLPPPLKTTAEPTPQVAPVPAPQPQPPSLAEPMPVQPDCCIEPIITPRMTDVGANPSLIVPQTALYRDIYFSIPFNRAEYNAYPSYRHDATMEFLFNQMRPTVIQRGTSNVYHYGAGYGYGMGSGLNYAYGPGYGYGPGFPQQYYPYNYGLRIHSSR